MKRGATVGALCIILMAFATVQLDAQSWQVYDASLLPTETEGVGGDSLDLSNLSQDELGTGFVEEIIDDPDITGNKILKYLNPDGKRMYRYYFDEPRSDSVLTMIARVKGEDDPAYDRIFDLQWRNGTADSRDELRIWAGDSTLELEKADVEVKAEADFHDWHTIRIAVDGDLATVYIDEDPTPVVSGASLSTSSDNYIKIGDGSGDAIGGYLDWCILDTTGAYAPDEGTPIPAELYVDGIPMPPAWLVYDASVLPTETGDADFDLTSLSQDETTENFVEEIIDDPVITGNKILKYLNPDGKRMYRYYLDEEYADSNMTMIARVKGEDDPAYDRVFDLQWRNGNADSRDELRISAVDSTLELEKSDVEVKVDMDLYAWHTYRIVVEGDLASIYIDEDPTAVVSGVSLSTSGDKYVKIGDGSGDAIGGYLDWCILDVSGAYAPGEGLEIPAELYVDGTPIPPSWKVYDGSVLPGETTGEGDQLDISSVSDDSPGDDMVQEIIDDPDISGNKIFKYLQPNGKTSFRHYFYDGYTDSAFTIVARVRGDTSSVFDRAFDFDWRNGNAGTRDKLLLWTQDNLLELDDNGAKVDPGITISDWHTYRIAVNGDMATVYIDEDPVAVHSATTANTTSSKYLKMGDGSGDAIGGYMDWCILDMSGAYAPGEGEPIPPYLYVDGGPPPAKWLVYDAGVLPTETEDAGGDTLDISDISEDSPGTGMVAEIIDDPDITGNKIFKYLQPDGKTMYRHYLDDEYADSNLTFIARVKGEMDAAYDRVFDLQWRNGNAGTRDELRISAVDSTLELEKADIEVKLDVDFYAWHTFRIVVSGDLAEVYMDENPEPVISGVSTSSTDAKYIKIGDGSGDAIGGYLDWCILDVSGAYAPDEGLPIPEELYVDHGPEPIVPKWLVYDAGIMPSETEDAGDDTLDISSISEDSPGSGFVEEIIDDPDITGNKLLKYLQPDGKTMYRHYFDERFVDSSLTMIARVKGENDPAYDRAFDLQWRNGNANSRDELRISPVDSTLELEKADVEVKVNMDLYEWHTYRIVVTGDLATVYMDEYKEPVISGTSTSGSSDLYVKIGDGSGDAIGGYLDWIILDISGGYAPDEGLPIPDELYVDEYVFIAEPGWRIYDGSVLPTESGSGGDSLDISSLSEDSPGDDMVELIIDDPDIEGNKLFQYEQPTSPYSRMYRTYFNEYWKGTEFTLIARTKGLEGYDMGFNLQWRHTNAGARDEVRLYTDEGRIKLDKSDVEIYPEFSLTEWHTFRVAVYGDSSAVFVDEDPTPVITGISGDGTSDSYIKIGDRGDGSLGALLDWMILDISGAYAPGEGVPVPDELYVDVPDNVDDLASALPKKYSLSQNYPNPFNPTTTIKYELPKSGKVVISLYDMLGKEVMTLVNDDQPAGSYAVMVDADRLASGIYFYRMRAGNYVQTRKMILLK